VLAVGASTGGPQALAALLAPLPAHCPVPIVIVQHVLPGFAGFLAQRLGAQLQVSVGEGAHDRRLFAGHALIMVGGVHCNFYPESSLADFSADLAADGESEETILEILERGGRRIARRDKPVEIRNDGLDRRARPGGPADVRAGPAGG